MRKKISQHYSDTKCHVFKDTYHKDKRGTIWTSWSKEKIKMNFNHDKFSMSKKNVLRGFHGDSKTWKLISCVYGEFLFVVVNYDKKSKNYLKKQKWILSQQNKKKILVPPKFLNAHLCLSKECIFHYKLFYNGKYNGAKYQLSIAWNDKRLNVNWPVNRPILSSRDSHEKD